MFSAVKIRDSISPQSHRLTTLELCYPKFIHGELMTHRVLSRNASSSRAIPTTKLIQEVRSDELRAGPVEWGMNQPGMQATTLLEERATEEVKKLWARAANNAADVASLMLHLGIHKQIVNRLLEPFSHIRVVVSATEYMNFFGLRLDKAAQPEMRTLAEAMWRAYNEGEPRKCEPGVNWHLPYTDDDLFNDLQDWAAAQGNEVQDKLMMSEQGYSGSYAKDLGIRVSVARCARVSYRSFETGIRSTVMEDLALYDRLLGAQPLHASPAEHQATPDQMTTDERPSMTSDWPGGWVYPEEHGNFVGWRQYRKMLPNEACAPLPPGYSVGAI